MNTFNMRKFLTEAKLPDTIKSQTKELKSLLKGFHRDILKSIQTNIENLEFGGGDVEDDILSTVDDAIKDLDPDLIGFDAMDAVDELKAELMDIESTARSGIRTLDRARPIALSIQKEVEKLRREEDKENGRKK